MVRPLMRLFHIAVMNITPPATIGVFYTCVTLGRAKTTLGREVGHIGSLRERERC
jgi:hypothetical protein